MRAAGVLKSFMYKSSEQRTDAVKKTKKRAASTSRKYNNFLLSSLPPPISLEHADSFSSPGMNYYTYEQLVRGSMQYSVVAILDTVRFALDLLCFNIILLKCASERFREPYTA